MMFLVFFLSVICIVLFLALLVQHFFLKIRARQLEAHFKEYELLNDSYARLQELHVNNVRRIAARHSACHGLDSELHNLRLFVQKIQQENDPPDEPYGSDPDWWKKGNQ